MAESSAPTTGIADDWVIDRLYGEDAGANAPQPQLLDDDAGGAQQRSRDDAAANSSTERAPTVAQASAAEDPHEADVNAGARRSALGLGVAVIGAAVLIVGAFMVCSRPSRPEPATPTAARPTVTVSAAPRESSASAAPDQAVPFTAAAPGCKTGSTPAQSLSDTDGDSAWVCVRGTPDEQADGQVLHIEFRCDPARPASLCSYLVTSVSVTPGSVPASPDRHDDWLAHRVVSRLQYNFYNGGELTDILTQDTGNVHGPATETLRHPVLASQVTVIVLQTARPLSTPVTNPNIAAAQAQPGLIDPGTGVVELPVPVPAPTASDPVDAAFAMSGMRFFGHQPT